MLRKMVVIAGLVLVLGVGAVAYSYLRTPEAATAPIETIPLSSDSVEPEEPAALPATEAILQEPAGEAPAPEPELETGPAAEVNVFRLVQTDSEARFIIDEILNGSPKTVVGITDQVSAEIALDFGKPETSQLGTILINARTLTTDNDLRNRALKNRILFTDSFEFISFNPTEILGLPATVAFGQAYSFQVAGDLTIRDITQPVVFDVEVTPLSETELRGLAVTTILYADYGIVIPQARSVTAVDDQVRLELAFTAAAG